MTDAHLPLGNRSKFGLICPSRNGTNIHNEDSEHCIGAKLDQIKSWEWSRKHGGVGVLLALFWGALILLSMGKQKQNFISH